MNTFNIRDTAAYKIVDQMISHAWGGAKWEDKDLVNLYRLYSNRGGSWEKIINGDPQSFQLLEKSIGDYLNYRDIIDISRGLCSE